MNTTLKSPPSRFLTAVQAFRATPETIAALVPANCDSSARLGSRVTREEIVALFGRDLYSVPN